MLYGFIKRLKTETFTETALIDVLRDIAESFVIKHRGIRPRSLKTAMSKPITKVMDIQYCLAAASKCLPESFKLLGGMYKILMVTHRLNQKKGLSFIFLEYRDSIERLFNHRIEIYHLEQLNYILKGYDLETPESTVNNTVTYGVKHGNLVGSEKKANITFTPISILYNGAYHNTYTIKIDNEVEIDRFLFDYFMKEYRDWLIKNNIVLDSSCEMIDPRFDSEGITIPRMTLGCSKLFKNANCVKNRLRYNYYTRNYPSSN